MHLTNLEPVRTGWLMIQRNCNGHQGSMCLKKGSALCCVTVNIRHRASHHHPLASDIAMVFITELCSQKFNVRFVGSVLNFDSVQRGLQRAVILTCN